MIAVGTSSGRLKGAWRFGRAARALARVRVYVPVRSWGFTDCRPPVSAHTPSALRDERVTASEATEAAVEAELADGTHKTGRRKRE